MPDRFDLLFDEVREDPLPAPFAPPEEIRRRGRLRSQRQAASAGVALLAVLGLGAGGLAVAADPSDPQPAATTDPQPAATTAPSTPPPTEIPQRWLLAPDDFEDVGPGEWVYGYVEDAERLDGWYWSSCRHEVGYPSETYAFLSHRLDQEDLTWYESEEKALADDWNFREFVELYDTGWGEASMDGLRSLIERCSERPTPGMELEPTYYTVLDEDFAGDDSLLIQSEHYQSTMDPGTFDPEPGYIYTAVLRVGDLVHAIQYVPWQQSPAAEGPDYVRDLARRAAERL
jgi:hypothetical protein